MSLDLSADLLITDIARVPANPTDGTAESQPKPNTLRLANPALIRALPEKGDVFLPYEKDKEIETTKRWIEP